MEWRDIGFVLAARRHGESGLIAELLTRDHGRHAGLVRGGQSPRRRALFQPANHIVAHWRGRLPEHLGSFDCELVEAHAVWFLDDPDRLAAVTSAIALLLAALPEREPNADLYEAFAALLAALTPFTPAPASGGRLGRGHSAESIESWARSYVEWECGLLAALGFGLDLMRCAATGATDDLAFVSPRTGRAVSRAAAAPYRDKLLPLPRFMWRDSPAGRRDISVGLALTGYFLLHHLLEPHGRQLPDARERLAERLRRPASAV